MAERLDGIRLTPGEGKIVADIIMLWQRHDPRHPLVPIGERIRGVIAGHAHADAHHPDVTAHGLHDVLKDTKQAAAIEHVDESQIRRRCEQGFYDPYAVKVAGRWVIHRNALEG